MGVHLDLLRQEIKRQGRPIGSPQGNTGGAVAHRGGFGRGAVLRLRGQRQRGKQQRERCEQRMPDRAKTRPVARGGGGERAPPLGGDGIPCRDALPTSVVLPLIFPGTVNDYMNPGNCGARRRSRRQGRSPCPVRRRQAGSLLLVPQRRRRARGRAVWDRGTAPPPWRGGSGSPSSPGRTGRMLEERIRPARQGASGGYVVTPVP